MDAVLERDIGQMHNYEQKQLKWHIYSPALAKVIERHYRARLIRVLEVYNVGPIAVCGANDPVDLLIAGSPVELKVCRARRKKQRGEYYQALLYNLSHRHHLSGDVIVMLCVNREDELYPYIIPRRAVGTRRTIEITSSPDTYDGQWAEYLDAFEHFRGGK